MMKQIMKQVKQQGKNLRAAGSTENTMKNMPWQGRQTFQTKII